MPETKEEKKTEFVNEWTAKIKSGIEFRKKYSSKNSWKEYRKMYRGQWADGVVPVNKMFSFGRLLVPRVYFRSPRISVTATRPDLVPHARVVESIDNMLIRETLLKETLKASIPDSFLCGVGPIKLGYDSEFGYLPDHEVLPGETATQVSNKDAERIEYHPGIKPGMPWALRVRPEDVVVPWGSGDQWSLPWVAQRILRPLDDIKQDAKYENTKDLQGTRTSDFGEDNVLQMDLFSSPNSSDKVGRYSELWEIRDYRSKQIIVICENEVLLAVDDALQIGGLPWEFLMFNPDPEYFWAIPDAVILEPQQKELNETRTQISQHRAIALLKFLYKKGSIDPTELQKALSGVVGIAAGVEGDEPITNVLQTIQPHIPPDLYKEIAAILNDMRESLGVSANEESSFSRQQGKTATESMIVSQAFEQRVDERRDIMADVLTRIVRKWNQFLFSFWTEEKVVQVTGIQGEPVWVKFTGDQLKGEYFLNVDAESGQPISRVLKYQMGKDLMDTFGGDELIDQVLLRQMVLENYSVIDPRADRLLRVPPMGIPSEIAANRQPTPIRGGGGGKGSGGGRQGSSPEKPEEFDSFKQRFRVAQESK